jgi:hypothetical protein
MQQALADREVQLHFLVPPNSFSQFRSFVHGKGSLIDSSALEALGVRVKQ